MFCRKCGAEINDGAAACSKCGCAATDIRQKKMSMLAIAGFIFGFLCGPAGIILGICALLAISKNINSLKGKGFAIAGIVIGAVSSALFVIVLIAAVGSFNNLAGKAAVYNGPPKFIEFKLVSSDAEKLKSAVARDVPDGYELKRSLNDDEPLLLEKESLLTGDAIENASVVFDRDEQFNSPTVSGKFNREGAKKFAEITAANIGRRIAILVDGEVLSAPVVREAIPTGDFVISGNFSFEEAHALAGGLNSYARSKK